MSWFTDLFKKKPEPPAPKPEPIRPVIAKIVAMIDAEDFNENWDTLSRVLSFAGKSDLRCSVHERGLRVYLAGAFYAVTEEEKKALVTAIYMFDMRKSEQNKKRRDADQCEAIKAILAYTPYGPIPQPPAVRAINPTP